MSIRVASGLRATYKNAVEMKVEVALNVLPTRTDCYEMLGDVNRVFLDIDGKRLPQEMTQQEWEDKRDATREAIEQTSDGQPYSLMDSSNYPKRIISFRVVYTKVKTTKASNKEFAAKMRETMRLPEGVSVDTSPYGENQKIRMLGSSKDGEDRPFVLVHGDPVDTLISYVGDAEERVYAEKRDEDPRNPSPIVAVEQERLVNICKLIHDARWEDYSTCLRLIFALKSCGSTEEFIHEQCMRAPNYGRHWVDRAIRGWNPEKTPTFGTLMYYARLDNPLRLDGLVRESSEVAIEEMMKLDTTNCPPDDLRWCDEGRWLKELPYEGDLAVSSMLCTGKTRRMIDLCRKPEKPCIFSKKNDAPTYKRILFLSVRITFSDHIQSEIQFVDYRDKASRDEKGMITADRALVSIQSMWRYEGIPDLLVLDEVETIHACLSPNTTHGKHYLANVAAYERIVRGAGRVVALDAFLTDRTVDMMKALRPAVRVLVNPAIPFNRTSKVFCDASAYLTECDRRIKAGKKAYMFWGAKKKGIAFHEMMRVPNRMYHADSDAAVKKRDLSDVNTHWSGIQIIGATSSISVGVNYTGKPAFDQVFAYATAWGGGSGRDTMQAIHRVRDLTDNEMLFFIDPKPNTFVKGEMGLAEQEKEYGETHARHTEFLKTIGEVPTDYATLPRWLRSVIVWNRNERLVNSKHLRQVCFAYMKRCGIAITLDGRADGTVVIEKAQCRHHSEVDDIEYEQAEEYKRHRLVLTADQKLELEKYYLMQRVVECRQGIWEDWLQNRSVINNAWALFNLTPQQIVHGGEKCVDLIPKSAEKLALLLSVGIDLRTDWSRSLTDLPELNLSCLTLRKQGKKEGKEQDYRDFAKGMADFCGLNLSVVRKRSMVKGVRNTTYSLEHRVDQNPLLALIRRPTTCGEAFGPE